MIFNQTNRKDLRELFCNAITKIFGNSAAFLDFIKDEKYSTSKYDCYLDYDGENYIINRETGEYINWYKLSHVGRCINISTLSMYKNIPSWIEEFLDEFKESGRLELYEDICNFYKEHDMPEYVRVVKKDVKEHQRFADWFNALKEIWDCGSCNDCGNKQCEWKPKLGQLVRFNCPHYVQAVNEEVNADADSDKEVEE